MDENGARQRIHSSNNPFIHPCDARQRIQKSIYPRIHLSLNPSWWLEPLDPPRVNHRMKRHDRRAFLRFDGHAVEIPVVTRFAQPHVDRLRDFVARLGLAARAHDELVTAPITLSER